VEVILVVRGGRAFWPTDDSQLESGDRLIALASSGIWAEMAAEFDDAATAAHRPLTPIEWKIVVPGWILKR
jgi:hypothetical protein